MKYTERYNTEKNEFVVFVREPFSVSNRTANGTESVNRFEYLDIKSDIIENRY